MALRAEQEHDHLVTANFRPEVHRWRFSKGRKGFGCITPTGMNAAHVSGAPAHPSSFSEALAGVSASSAGQQAAGPLLCDLSTSLPGHRLCYQTWVPLFHLLK